MRNQIGTFTRKTPGKTMIYILELVDHLPLVANIIHNRREE
jgi:hypothetical protein